MHKKTVSTLLLTLLLLGMSTLAFNTQPVRAEPRTWTVDDDGLADFSSIQEAIDSPLVADGDTIFVHSGTYYENLVVNKAVSLIGEKKETTIIDGNEVGTVVLVTVSNLFIGGFTIQRSGEPNVGIAVVWSNNNTIDGNVIINNQFGIWLNFSDNNEVRGNVVANNVWDGIFLLGSGNNTATMNTIFGCERGIRLEGSNNNVVKRNNVTDNHTGLAIGLSYNDTVTENTFSDCLYGISLFKSGNDLIYHNNLINNLGQASTYRSYDNSWDDGYPSGGNYWSNYNGTDIDLDGIGDSRYIIDANNVDNHPLMGRFYSYCIPSDFGQGLGVTIVSNSTVSNFSVGKVVAIPIINSTSINSDGWKVTSGTRIIMFNISGETGLGFCRLCIPKALMAPPYTVAINRGPASPIYYNEKMFDNSTHRWIYFTYSHLTTHEVWIVGQKDTTPPVITLLSPKNRTYTSSFIPLTLTLNEPTSWIGYSLNGQTNVTISGNTTIVGLSDGVHTIIVYANDTAGNLGYSDTVYFSVDTVATNIEILSPENKTYTTSSGSLSFTVDEATSWISYSLDGEANMTIAGNTTLMGLSDGMHSLIVYASDIAGNIGSSDMVYFTIDTTPPIISILSPENRTYDTTDIPLTFTVDESVSWMAYSLDNTANVTITGNSTLSGLSDGSHSLIVYARDNAGNTGASDMVYFSVETPQPEPFPVEMVVAVIGIMAVVGAAVLVYFLKFRK